LFVIITPYLYYFWNSRHLTHQHEIISSWITYHRNWLNRTVQIYHSMKSDLIREVTFGGSGQEGWPLVRVAKRGGLWWEWPRGVAFGESGLIIEEYSITLKLDMVYTPFVFYFIL
jgi:hypothetical protein